MKIWQRVKNLFGEPTLWLAALAAGLNFLVTFQLDWLSAEQASLWAVASNAVVGVIAALKTRPIAPTAFTYAVTSLAGLLAAYGLDASQETVGQFNLLVLSVLALVTRGEVSPTETAEQTGVLGNRVTTAPLRGVEWKVAPDAPVEEGSEPGERHLF